MLTALDLGDGQNLGTANGRIALDCSVRTTRQGHACISTTDFFFPLVDSPYLQGRIGAANVLSDLYAEGVGTCDFVLMLLAACRDMGEDDRQICTREMVRARRRVGGGKDGVEGRVPRGSPAGGSFRVRLRLIAARVLPRPCPLLRRCAGSTTRAWRRGRPSREGRRC